MVIELFVKTSFPELFSKYNVEVEIREVNVYGGGAVVFDDVLDHNQNLFVPIFTRGRNKWHYVFFISTKFWIFCLIKLQKLLKTFEETLQELLKSLKNLQIFVEKPGKIEHKLVFLLVNLKRKLKITFAFLEKANWEIR